MSSLEELKGALRDTLAARGSLGQIQARVRAEIFNALEETDDPKPPMSHENLIINELIREYLDYNQYKHTLSVLLPETGQPAERIERSFIAQDLGVRDDAHSRQIPLLYTIISRLQHENNGGRGGGGGGAAASSRRSEHPAAASPGSPQRPTYSRGSSGGASYGAGAQPGRAVGGGGGMSRDVRASRDPDPIVM